MFCYHVSLQRSFSQIKKRKKKVTIINRRGFEEDDLSNRYYLQYFFFFSTPASRALELYSYIFIDIYIFTNKIQVPPKNAAKLKLCQKTKGIREHSQYICTYDGGGEGRGQRAVLTRILQNVPEGISVIFCPTVPPPVRRCLFPFRWGRLIPSTPQAGMTLLSFGLVCCFFAFP